MKKTEYRRQNTELRVRSQELRVRRKKPNVLNWGVMDHSMTQISVTVWTVTAEIKRIQNTGEKKRKNSL